MNTKHLTTDINDPNLNDKEFGQNTKYLILEDEKRKNFVRPVRQVYLHNKCKTTTRMGLELSETYAVNPKFYSHTYCCFCGTHYPVTEFIWNGTNELVGS